MAAGLGFKTFTTGEVLTAGDVNGYLMQGINVFANATARNAAITSPQEGQYSYLKDTNALEYYDGAAWVGAPVGDITAVTAGKGLTGGGSSGDVTVSLATTAKGDLVAGSGASTAAVLTVGANNTVLTADSTTTTGLKWGTVSSGAVVQVKSAIYSTSTSNATTTYTDTGLSVSITPTSASNKILVIVSQSTRSNYTSAAYENAMKLRINRDSTAIYNDGGDMWYVANTNQTAGGDYRFYQTMVYLDSPASTSALTYKTQQRIYTGTVTCQPFGVPSTITVMEVTP